MGAQNFSTGVGLGAFGPLAAMACSSVEVFRRGHREGGRDRDDIGRTAVRQGKADRMPCGLASGAASGIIGTPVVLEKRTVTGTGENAAPR
jgi:hypothetical protein